ncbi:MAG: hypothetical protein JOZ32_03150 [Bryobacterales bacterium]|nr:hypothetical protein [Bryobacterales bacterium]
MSAPTIHQKIEAYCKPNDMGKRHLKEYSWLNCYRHFRETTPETLAGEAGRDHAALHLGFYLASWGMFRNSFLSSHAYTIHYGVIDRLLEACFSDLWKEEFGITDNDSYSMALVVEAIKAVREAYKPFASPRQPSDTLVTKVLFGTFGCVPACDTYFQAGFRSCGFQYGAPNDAFLGSIFHFCKDHLCELRKEQTWIEGQFGVRYPLMKIIDMYFWQIGSDRLAKPTRAKSAPI